MDEPAPEPTERPPTAAGGAAYGGGPFEDPGARPSPLPGAPLPGTPYAYDPYAWGRAPRVVRQSPAWMRLPANPPPRWGIGDVFWGLAAWLFASTIFTIPGVVAAIASGERTADGQPTVEPTGPWAILALVGGWVGFVGYLWFASRHKGAGTFARDFGFRFTWLDPLIGVATGFATLIVTGLVNVAITSLAGEQPAGNEEAIFGGQRGTSIGLVVMAIGGAIGAPIVEELFFRGLVLRAVERRFGAVIGVVASSAIFALLHVQPGGDMTWLGNVALIVIIVLYAVVFALLTRATGRLGPAIFAHMTINGLSVAFLVYSKLY